MLYSIITIIFNVGSSFLVVFISIKSVAKKYVLDNNLNDFLKYIKILYGVIFLLYVILGISSGSYLSILFNGIMMIVIYIVTSHFAKKLIKKDYNIGNNSQNYANNNSLQGMEMNNQMQNDYLNNNQNYNNYNNSNNEQPTYMENNNLTNNEIYNTNSQTEQINNSEQNNYVNNNITENEDSLNNSQTSQPKINYFSDNK